MKLRKVSRSAAIGWILEKEISVEDMQKIVDANEKLVKELKDGTNPISK